MLNNYSGFTLFKQGILGKRAWQPAWVNASPAAKYDVIVIGGGGHGLATAYYLAKNHGVRRVAVIEKGWLGGGNTGRNTTVIKSNYFYPESAAIYGLSHRLYEGLSKELNYNTMISQRGMLTLAHSEPDLEMTARAVNAMQLNGIDAELLGREQVRKIAPHLDFSANARFPIHGSLWQKRAGTGRHDAVAWGYARGAYRAGVDIIQNCEVTDFIIEAGQCSGVQTTLGEIRADRVGIAVAGHSSVMAKHAGFELPVLSYALQAFVTEPVKPIIDTVVASPALGTYISQSDKGGLVIGGMLDRVPSYGQRGNLPAQENVLSGIVNMFPSLGPVKLLRQWAGIVDVTPDSSPIIGQTGIPGLYINCGWGTGGFKAIPAGGTVFAHVLATGEHHPYSRAFDRGRFDIGHLIDEGAAAGIAH